MLQKPFWLLLLLLRGTGLFRVRAFASASPPPPAGKTLLTDKKVVVVGGGPVGLYFAALLLDRDPTVEIEILEQQAPRTLSSNAKSNAFGMGVSDRMGRYLRDVPGLYEQATSVSAMVAGLNIPLVSRSDLVRNMRNFLEDRYDDNQCRVSFGEGCASVDFDQRVVTTEGGRAISYDLLLGADGVNSKIRRLLVDRGDAEMGEEHYTENSMWKALQLPKQPDVEADSFMPLRHPRLIFARILPRAPEGHFILTAWKNEDHDPATGNPRGISTADDWSEIMNEALRDEKPSRFAPVRKLIGLDVGDSSRKNHRNFVFDEELLEDFCASRGKPMHHLKLDRYHYPAGSVALIGDSAHSFNSGLGQGCALGLQGVHTLVDCLLEKKQASLETALASYTDRATIESHAMTELSLINYGVRTNLCMTVRAVPLVVWNMLQGKGLLKRIRDTKVPYSEIARENGRLLKLCRKQFEKERKPYVRSN